MVFIKLIYGEASDACGCFLNLNFFLSTTDSIVVNSSKRGNYLIEGGIALVVTVGIRLYTFL